MAALLACSPSTLDRYVAAGCPVLSKGKTSQGHEFDSDAVMRWLRGRLDGSPNIQNDDSKRRYTAAVAELKEYQLAEKRGQMVAIEDVMPAFSEQLAAVRSRLLAMTGRMAQSVAAMSDPAAVERAIMDEIVGALSEITCG
jgi:phage terminase Nu1 subunit (DNA packaging protein)